MIESALLRNTFQDADREEIRKLPGPILVIGAGGFVGSHVFLQLRSVRDDVFGGGTDLPLRWRLSWLPENVRAHSLVHLDITDEHSVRRTFRELKPQTVLNFSAYGAYESQSDSTQIMRVNVQGVLNLLKAAEEFRLQAFVNAGSSSEYGLNCRAPSEKSELIPNSEYAVSKAAAGSLIKYFATIKDLPAIQLRLYSVYGPWEEPSRLIPKLVECGTQGRFPPLVGEQISRDFIFVDDALRAFVKTALAVCQSRRGISLNVGTGRATSLGEVAKIAKELFAIQEEPQFGSMPARRWDLSNWYADITLLAELTGWRPQVDFKTGLRFTAEWEKTAQIEKLIKTSAQVEKRKKVSAVVACYRDNLAIPIMYERLVETFTKSGVDFEIIFVNDCSPTNDKAVIHAIVDRDPRVIGVSHSRNFGSQNAFLSGMEVASGDAVVLFDGDLQDPPEVVEKFIEKWREGFEVVYGQRIRREAPYYMQFFYRLFYRIFRRLADVAIPLDAGDFSLMDRKVVNRLLAMTERDFFLRGLRAWVGFNQIGVPYHRPERMFGQTTNNFSKNIWWAKKGIFSFSVKPLDYVQYIGFFTFIVSLCLGLFYAVYYFISDNQAPRGITTQLILTLAMGGLQILSLSIIGEYIKKIIEEVKGRPRYIRSEIYGRSSSSNKSASLD